MEDPNYLYPSEIQELANWRATFPGKSPDQVLALIPGVVPSSKGVSRRQFKNGKVEPSLMMREAAAAVVKALPKDWAFALMAFPLDSRDGGLRYVSSGDRESVLKLLREFVEKQGGQNADKV